MSEAMMLDGYKDGCPYRWLSPSTHRAMANHLRMRLKHGPALCDGLKASLWWLVRRGYVRVSELVGTECDSWVAKLVAMMEKNKNG